MASKLHVRSSFYIRSHGIQILSALFYITNMIMLLFIEHYTQIIIPDVLGIFFCIP